VITEGGDIDIVLLGNLQNRLTFFSHDVSAVDLEIDHEKTCLPLLGSMQFYGPRNTLLLPDPPGP
jgi:hypothetical protein